LSHVFGRRRYKTTDTSRNNWLLAFITMGEGWHNNHHYHQNTANQGWFWWEIDVTYYTLKVLSWLRLVWDVREPSPEIKYAHLKYSLEDKMALRESGAFALRPKLARVRQAKETVKDALVHAAEATLPVAAQTDS
jgi:stearoyl-CoA desaturase (delta-9 desaturase)